MYDSTNEILDHIKEVGKLIDKFINCLKERKKDHDKSKFDPFEKKYSDTYLPLLKELEYGSEQYIKVSDLIKPASELHWKRNRHHPEFHKNGIEDMNLVDLIEMLCDQSAACKRQSNGSMKKSFEFNCKKYNISKSLRNILENTIRDFRL